MQEHTFKYNSGKIYFASDFHLGIPDYQSSLKREKKLIAWLDQVRNDAAIIFLMGDLFDFWFEYKTVVPKGYTRLFGKLAEITDSGIPVHMFRGNHDIWAFDYLNKELNITLHRNPIITKFGDKNFFLAHGDGLGPGDNGYKFLKKIFEFKPNQWLFRWLHPDIGARMGLYFSHKSRLAHMAYDAVDENEKPFEEEMLLIYSKEMLTQQSNINYFIFGHRHIPIQHSINEKCDLIILGDWISKFTYAVFDGQKTELKQFK